VFIVFVYFVNDSIRKLLDTPSYVADDWINFVSFKGNIVMIRKKRNYFNTVYCN
jgi:hypothetical protein